MVMPRRTYETSAGAAGAPRRQESRLALDYALKQRTCIAASQQAQIFRQAGTADESRRRRREAGIVPTRRSEDGVTVEPMRLADHGHGVGGGEQCRPPA